MKITLKKLKLVKSQSRETHCFSAVICLDGVPICEVENDGHGASDNYHPLAANAQLGMSHLHAELKLINDELGKETIQGHGFEIANSLDIVVGELINQMQLEKEVKSLIRRRVCYVDKDGGIRQLQAKFKPSPENFAIAEQASWWKSSNVFMKDMSMEDACNALRNG